MTLAIETIRRLQGTIGNESNQLISDVESNSGNYAPPVLFVLAGLLYKQGKSDDAIFWFNAACLRANFDAARCADVSARSAVPAVVGQIPVQLRRSQFDDPAKLKDIIHRVVQWDESTPYNYDYRWINLHGLDAIRSGLGNADATNKPLSLPREEWGALAQKTTRRRHWRPLSFACRQHQHVSPARAKRSVHPGSWIVSASWVADTTVDLLKHGS